MVTKISGLTRQPSVQEMLANANLMMQGGAILARAENRERRKRAFGTSDVTPEFAQTEVKHIDHYIDGVSAKPRERRPFSPLQYMRTGKGEIAA